MILNPYETSIGLHFNTKNLELKLSEFLIKGRDTKNLNYEYVIDKEIDVIFITGKNEDEKDLPIWNHPLFITDFRGSKKIFVDMRPYVRPKKDEEIININSIVTNKLGFDFTIIRVIYMVLLHTNKNSIDNISNNLAIAFSKWVSTSIKSALYLDVESVIKLEVLTLHYILCKFNDSKLNGNDIDNIYFKISKLHKALKGNVKYVRETCIGINTEPKDVVDLANNIRIAIKNPLVKDMTSAMIYNILSTTWFGINPNENITMSLEHIPTLIAIVGTSLESKVLKHSRLSNILNENKRTIGGDELMKNIYLTVKDQIV